MAATLPPINHGGSAGRSGMKQTQPVHFAPAPPKGPPSGRLKPLKKQREKELSFQSQTSQKSLTKRQTTAYRNTYKHNLCVEMLQEGFHLSFRELFSLIRQQEDDRQAAGSESLIWTMTLLKDEHEKLDMLKKLLTRAETATRKGDFSEVYRNRYELARYFQSTGDKWLADHFFSTCLQTSRQVSTDGGKMQAEGFCNVALAQEENGSRSVVLAKAEGRVQYSRSRTGDYYGAAENFEAYYKLSSSNRDWITADGILFHTDACINLARIYTTIGNHLEAEDPSQALEYLVNAYTSAKESHQQRLEGESAFRLGLAYDTAGDGESALLHLNNYLNICRETNDNDGIGQACDAIAKAFAREGRVEESIEYLKQFVEVAEKSGQEQAYSKACHNLGNIFNTLGCYEEATKYFDKAYNLSRSMGDVDSINRNRVQFGVAAAHKMLMGVGGHIVLNTRGALERLIEWKSSRLDEFDKPVQEPQPIKPKTPPPSPPPTVREESEVQGEEEGEMDDQLPEQEERKGTTATSTVDDTDTVTETTESG